MVVLQFTPEPGAVEPLEQKAVVDPYVVEKHASATTLPVRNGCVLSTPVSRIAIVWPLPVELLNVPNVSPPINGILCCNRGGSAKSCSIRSISGDAESTCKSAASTSNARYGINWNRFAEPLFLCEIFEIILV